MRFVALCSLLPASAIGMDIWSHSRAALFDAGFALVLVSFAGWRVMRLDNRRNK